MNDSKIKITTKTYAYLSFLVWPIAALVMAIANYRKPWAKNIVWLFCGFYGFNFIIANEMVDANRYQEMLVDWYNNMNLTYFQLLKEIYEGNYGKGDFIQPTLTYFVSTFSTDGRILFALFGLVFGYFYSRNIWIMIDQIKGKLNLSSLPYLLLFILMIPIWDINGIRFWLAAHIFLYGALNIFLYHKKRYIFVAAAALLAHAAFIPAVGVLLFHQLIGNRKIIYISLFIVTSLIISIDLPTLVGYIPQTNTGADVKVAAYTHDEYVNNVKKGMEESAWFIKWKLDVIKYSFIILIFWAFIFKSKAIKKYDLESFFYFSILFLAIANVVSIIPSGSRYMIIANLFLAGFFFVFIQRMTSKYWINRLNIFLILPILFFLVIQIRLGLDYTGYNTLFSNPMLAAYFDNKVSIFSLISG